MNLFYKLLSASVDLHVDQTLIEKLQDNVLFMIALVVIFGVLGGWFVEKIRFPKVTGYIVVGLIVGPSILGVFSEHMVESLTIVRQVAIGFIGYTIGLELRISELKETGKQVTVITIAQALVTAVAVAAMVILFIEDREHKWTYGLILGAIATATAPAPIIAVVKGYNSKGPVSDMLLPLVALDDVIGIIFFSIMLSLGTVLLNLNDQVMSFGAMLMEPAREIGVSLASGVVIGAVVTLILVRLRKKEKSSDEMYLLVILGALFLGIGFGLAVHASAILLPMAIGAVITNFIPHELEHKLSRIVNLFSAPVILTFFMIAGMELNISILGSIGVIGIVYIVVRVVGKVTGSYFSAKAIKAPPTVIKYLGWTLIPQAGVAIDMALTADMRFKSLAVIHGDWVAEIGTTIMTIVLAATLVYEVFGLIIVKRALVQAGEISEDVANEAISH